MTEAETERAAIVAWLRSGKVVCRDIDEFEFEIANAIERGEHLSSQTSNRTDRQPHAPK